MQKYIWLFTCLVIVFLGVAACTLPLPTLSTDQEPAASVTVSAPATPTAQAERALLEDDTPPPFDTFNWRTDFSRRSVPWSEIISGGPPKDGIPSIDDPMFESIASASDWLSERDPLILFTHEGTARAYPLSILIWHEIVNDEVEGLPVTVTFCPLCNASIVFDRRFDNQILDFGTTGRLRNSDLIMYDRQSESWWQQFTGEAIVGQYTGQQLDFLPSQVISFAEFQEQYPDGEVLARPTVNGQLLRRYGQNPYVGYDSSNQPFLFTGQVDERLPAVERVVGLTTPDTAKAYAFEDVATAGVIHDEFAGMPVVIFHKPGTASALDSNTISAGRDIGSVGVFDPQVDGQTLTFQVETSGNFVDEQTSTTWNILGQGIVGPLAGTQLEPVLHFDHFWFAWAAFFPETELYRP